MTTKRERSRRKQKRRSRVMTAGHRHREKLNSLASRLEKRAKPYQTGDLLLFIVFMVGVSIVAIRDFFNSDLSFIFFIFVMVVGVMRLVTVTAVSELTDLARRLRVETSTEKLRRDRRSPVLYLRPFSRDGEASKVYKLDSSGEMGRMVETTTGSEEELFVRFFERVGPVIAIGSPADRTPIIGATRVYLDEPTSWKDKVEALIDKASVVILHAGPTESLLWEVNAAIRKVEPERFIIVLTLEEKEYSRFLETTYTLFPSPLPRNYRPRKGLPTSITGFLIFDADWTARYIRMPSWFFKQHDGVLYLNAALPKIFEPFLSRIKALDSQQAVQAGKSFH